jgi:regulator of sigma E protease
LFVGLHVCTLFLSLGLLALASGAGLLFLLIEAIRRKPVNRKYESWVHAVGLVLFLALMLLVAFNDVLHHL